MQAQRDKIWTTVGWSLIGNFCGIFTVSYIDKAERWKGARYLNKREIYKVLGFAGTVVLFTIYGYGIARQIFVREKLRIVEEHSVKCSPK